MSNSGIQQSLNEMLQNLKLRNDLETEHLQQTTSMQESLAKINELTREKLLLDTKNIKVLEDIDKMLQERSERYEEELKQQKEINELNDKRLKQEQELSKQQKAMADIKKAAWAGAAAGAISALGTTINTVFKVGKIAVEAFVNVLGKVAHSAFNIGKSLLMLPWNMFKSLISTAANASGSPELLNAIEHVRKEWGSFSNTMSKDVLQVSSFGMNMKNVAVSSMQFYRESLAPGRSMMRVWESMAAMLKDVNETLDAMGPTLNVVIGQFKEADGSVGQTAKHIIAMQKGLGLAKEEFAALAKVSARDGRDIVDIEYEMGNLSLQLGDKFGISSKKISNDVGKMMKDVEHFGSLSTKQLTSVAAYTAKLGIETSKLLGLMDKFDQFEDSAESASKLSQAFGLQIDSMEMMRAEDPAERFDMLRQAMDRAGVSTDGMRRQSTKLLANLVGLDAETVKQGFSSRNLGKSYDEVKQAVEEASSKQLTQEQVLTRLADAIEKVNRAGGQLKDGFFKNFLDGIEKGIMRTPSFINMMVSLRQSLRTTLFQGMNVGEAITKSLGLDVMFNAIGEHFKPANMKKFFGDEGLGGAIKKIFDPKSSEQTIKQSFDKIINAFTNQKDGLMSKIYPQLQRLGDIFGKIGKLIITKIGEAIGNAFKGGAALLKGGDIGNNLQKEFENSPWGKFITPVWDGIKSAFLSMFDGFAELAPVLLNKALKAITWIFKGIEYLLASKEQRKALDATSVTGSYLSFDTTKKNGSQSGFEKSFDASFDKLSSGITSVFNDDKIWKPLKEALNGAWEELKNRFKQAWDYIEPYIKSFLVANLVLKIGTGVLTGMVGGFTKAFAENPEFRSGIIGKLKSVTNLFTKLPKALPIVGQVIAVMTALSDFATKKQDLRKKFEENEKIINASAAAGWASFLNIITLGLLGDDTLVVFGEYAQNISESMMEALGEFGNSIGNVFSSVSTVLEGLGDIVNAIFEIFDPDADAWSTFKFGIGKVLLGVIQFFSSAVDSIINGIVGAINFVIKKIGDIFHQDWKGIDFKSNLGDYMGDKIKDLQSEQEKTKIINEKNIRDNSNDGLLTKERRNIEDAEKTIKKLNEKESGKLSEANLISVRTKKQEEQNKILEILKTAFDKEQNSAHRHDIKEKIDKLTAETIKNTEELEKGKARLKHPGSTSQAATGQQAQQSTEVSKESASSQASVGQQAQQSTEVSKESASSQISSKIEETKGKIEETKKLISDISSNTTKIVDNNSELSINTGRVVVNLKNMQDNLMEGINSIKNSTRNVNVNVDVAVQLDIKELEEIIVSRKESKIRKAVSIIEKNIAPNFTPKTEQKEGVDGGTIAGTVFGQPR